MLDAEINIEDYFPLVGGIVNSYLPSLKALGIDYEDAFQTGCVGLVKALKIFDAKKAAFSTIATKAVRAELVETFRYYNRQMRSGCNNQMSLDYEVNNGTQRWTIADFFPSKTDVETDAIADVTLDYIASTFQGKRRRIFNFLRYKQATSTEVQKTFNLTNGALQCDLNAIRRTTREVWYGVKNKKAAH